MAIRELRAGWTHVSYFIICIALGVGSIVGVSSLSDNLGDAVQHDAKALMAGDLEIRTHRALGQEDRAFLQELSSQNIRWIHIYEMLAMASDVEERTTQLVELKVVEHEYPFYGTLKTTPAHPLATLLMICLHLGKWVNQSVLKGLFQGFWGGRGWNAKEITVANAASRLVELRRAQSLS